jgi:hypothetical protein
MYYNLCIFVLEFSIKTFSDLSYLIVDLKTGIFEVVLPHTQEEGMLHRGHEESGQPLLSFPTQSGSIRSYTFGPVTSLHGCPCFNHAYVVKCHKKS